MTAAQSGDGVSSPNRPEHSRLFATTTDHEAAVRELGGLASKGNTEAQFVLGGLYLTGNPKGPVEGLKLLNAAAEGGHVQALGVLAYNYYAGKYIPRDHVEAMKWCILAAEAGKSPRIREPLSWQITSAEIQEAEQLARQWRSEHPQR